ncbi:Yip1 family protein [Anaerobacillus sp. MEB173]|uniref:Yip1 family protein n=1 Tax=Anaerobacillus sp. MEB173 TaxID=3383345 RepID=UPI003F8FDCAB
MDQKITHFNSLFTVWFKPRETMRNLLENPNPKFFYFMMLFYGLSTALFELSDRGIGQEMPRVVILFIEIILGIVVGLIWYYLISGFLKWLGSLLGGKGRYRDLQIAVVCHAIPYVVLTGLSILAFLLFGDSSGLSDEGLISLGIYILSGIAIILSVWSIIIFVICLSEAHRFSIKKALLLWFVLLPFYWIGSMSLSFIEVVQNEEYKTKPINEAISDFGYDVKTPSYITFKPKKEYGWIDKELNQLQITYQRGFSQELTYNVSPEKPLYYREIGEKVYLYDDAIGYYTEIDEVNRIDWYHDGLYYSMDYVSNDLIKKTQFLKIARSFK